MYEDIADRVLEKRGYKQIDYASLDDYQGWAVH